ncbi:MAG: hypothetical protein H7Y09_10345 [Chitinophagaceae bacterium]|nr:hypothetical protein [Anaerolineae bacterium]
MRGQEFFWLVLLLSMALLVLGIIIGRRRRRFGWDVIESLNFYVTLQFCFSTLVFALLPFPVYHLVKSEATTWGVVSLLLALFLLVEIGQLYYKMNVIGARWPWAMVALLIILICLFTAEVVNTLWWDQLSWYAWGLLWVLVVSVIQLIVFAGYDDTHDDLSFSDQTADRTENRPVYKYHGILPERLRRERSANHPYRAPNHHANIYSDPIDVAKRQRYANRYPFTRAHTGSGSALPNTPVRPDKDTRRR